MNEVGNAPASLTPAMIFAQTLSTGAMMDRVVAVGCEDMLDMGLEVVAVVAWPRG